MSWPDWLPGPLFLIVLAVMAAGLIRERRRRAKPLQEEAARAQQRKTRTQEQRAAVQAAFERLRANFENREAIYLEKGVLRVRVRNICAHRDTIAADIEEIPTRGMEDTMPHLRLLPRPLRWKIDGGFLTSFSDSEWSMGYGGWSLHFEPEVVQGLVDLAAAWTADLNTYERYKQALDFIQQHSHHGPHTRVFPERESS